MRAGLAYSLRKDSRCFHPRMLKVDSCNYMYMYLTRNVRESLASAGVDESGQWHSVLFLCPFFPLSSLPDSGGIHPAGSRALFSQQREELSACRMRRKHRLVDFHCNSALEVLWKGKLGSHNSSNQRGEKIITRKLFSKWF